MGLGYRRLAVVPAKVTPVTGVAADPGTGAPTAESSLQGNEPGTNVERNRGSWHECAVPVFLPVRSRPRVFAGALQPRTV